MNAVPLQQARQNPAALIDRITEHAEPVIIRSPEGREVVLLPMEEYASWNETERPNPTP